MARAQPGDRVRIHYTGRLADGAVFDSSYEHEPLEFTVGGGDVIPGVDAAVVDMETGERRTVSFGAERGYGPRIEGLEQEVPREVIPPEARVGDPLRAQLDNEQIVLWVTDTQEATATLDGNHPLAGSSLEFDIEMVAIDRKVEE